MSRVILNNALKLNVCRAFSKSSSKPPKEPTAAAKCESKTEPSKKTAAASKCKATPKREAVIPDVPGLSPNIVKAKSQPLGPGASSTGPYKVPEYYCYDRFSYHESEVEMAKFRCPQPSARN